MHNLKKLVRAVPHLLVPEANWCLGLQDVFACTILTQLSACIFQAFLGGQQQQGGESHLLAHQSRVNRLPLQASGI